MQRQTSAPRNGTGASCNYPAGAKPLPAFAPVSTQAQKAVRLRRFEFGPRWAACRLRSGASSGALWASGSSPVRIAKQRALGAIGSCALNTAASQHCAHIRSLAPLGPSFQAGEQSGWSSCPRSQSWGRGCMPGHRLTSRGPEEAVMGLALCPSHATIDRPCHYLNCMLQRNHIVLEGLGQLGTVWVHPSYLGPSKEDPQSSRPGQQEWGQA